MGLRKFSEDLPASERARQLALAERLIIMSARASAQAHEKQLFRPIPPEERWWQRRPRPADMPDDTAYAGRALLAIPALLTTDSRSDRKQILRSERGNPLMKESTVTFAQLGLLAFKKPFKLSPVLVEHSVPLRNTLLAARYPAHARSTGPRLESVLSGHERDYLLHYRTLGATAVVNIDTATSEKNPLALQQILYNAADMNLAIIEQQ